MSDNLLKLMRSVRQRARKLAQTIESDHRPFQHPAEPLFFFRLPSKPTTEANDLSITPTCTAWMSLATARRFPTYYSKKNPPGKDITLPKAIERAYARILEESWNTGRLPQNNAFTVSVVARSVGYLLNSKQLSKSVIDSTVRKQANGESTEPDEAKRVPKAWNKCNGEPIAKILLLYLEDLESTIALDPFPASPALAYWLVDAASLLPVILPEPTAQSLAEWAAKEFRRQYSLVAANHHTMMDPVALAMAACVCRALRRIASDQPPCYKALQESIFPSDNELQAAIRCFYEYQSKVSGVWEKYFPIFHYPKSGPNYCWHFEVLEAVIAEFPTLLKEENTLKRLDRALSWLESNRLDFSVGTSRFFGWNGGGDVDAMRSGQPESWPTGVAHMFLSRLQDKLSECISNEILRKYGDRVHISGKSSKSWKKYMDFNFYHVDTELTGRGSVKKIIMKELLIPAARDSKGQGVSPHFRLKRRCSAVLFGPPGTSKTTLCECIAERLGWPFIELSPSDFLGGGLEGIYKQVNDVFDDLLDLYGVVVLFDEMDALVQSRGGSSGDGPEGQLDVTQKFLTTSMLPKLQRLRKERRALFFMATNHLETFDDAIIRSGRFDLLVHMGPPSTSEKLERLDAWQRKETPDELREARSYLEKILVDDTKDRFDRFTFGELTRFFDALRIESEDDNLLKALKKVGLDLKRRIKEWTQSKITLCDDEGTTKGAWAVFKLDAKKTRIQ